MKALYLLRHAKADRDAPAIADFDRPLTRRGQDAAALLADYFEAEKIRPQIVLCSPSLRTRQTLEGIASALGDPPVRMERLIYQAGPETLLALLDGLPRDVKSALLVGHNPSIEMLAQRLAGNVPSEAARRMHEKYPTAALAIFSSPAEDWARFEDGCRLDAFIRPVDLVRQ